MERFRMRRTSSRDSSPSGKVVTGIDRSSERKPIPADRAQKGREERKKEYNIPKLSSNSTSRSTGRTTEDDVLTLHLGQRTSGLLTGTVMKKLLAAEMSRDVDSRRRPSVIARLMGLDGFPPPKQDEHKQHMRTCDNHHLKTASTLCHKYSKPFECQSHMRNSKEQEQFKDVYEVAESSRILGEGCQLQVFSSSKHSQDEMASCREKFIDVKQLFSYERFHDTKELNDALEVLDCNRDLLLKFLDQPDSEFAKHLHYLHDAREHLLGRDRGMKSSAFKHNINAIGCQSGWEDSRKIDISFSHEHQDSLHRRFCHVHGANSQKFPHLPANKKKDPSSIPTNIVVLKPNLAKLHSSSKQDSSHNVLSDFEACKEKDTRHGDIDLWGKTRLHDGLDMSGQHSRKNRLLPREITRQMKGKGSFNVSLNGYKGYSADESSLDLSGNDSSYDSDTNYMLSNVPLHRRSRGEGSVSRYSESSVTREAKKRLSERWKMTQRSHEIELVGKGSTLGEMLAVPELEVRLSNVEAGSSHDGFCKFNRKDGMAGSATHLGINCKDGWKDKPVGRLSKSRSLPASSDYVGCTKNSWRHEAFMAERFLVPKEHMSRHGNKATRRHTSVTTRSRRSGPVYHQDRGIRDVAEFQLDMNENESSFGDDNSPDVKAVISETPTRVIDASLITDAVVGLEPGSFPESLTSTDEQIAVSEFPGDVLVQDESCSTDLHESMTKEPSMKCEIEDSACSQCPASEQELPGTIKEAGQPSPNSILEASFMEDLSSGSECFERVHAELHGLRRQLQLLKLESEAYDEEPMLISSEEDDAREGSSKPSEARGLLDDQSSWVSSYLFDVLADSGFDDMDPEVLEATWHSAGYLIAHWIFERLEKKYSDQETNSRVERRLLFDRINSGMTEILNQVTDPHPWVNCRKRTVASPPRWDKDWIRVALCELLKWQEEEGVEIENAFHLQVLESRDLKWMDLGDQIDGVGREIEKQLIDELVGDFVNHLCMDLSSLGSFTFRYVNCQIIN
ncbi:hypothetical protein Dimus_034555 [Dionaea muscipula]